MSSSKESRQRIGSFICKSFLLIEFIVETKSCYSATLFFYVLRGVKRLHLN